MIQQRVRLTVEEAYRLAERALIGLRFAASDSRIIADHVVDTALCGYESYGLPKILTISQMQRFTEKRCPMRALKETDVSTLYDGGNNIGMLTLYDATKAAIAKAKRHGFALIAVTNTWMSGRSAYYLELIARADLVGLLTVSCTRAVAPLGGTRPVYGTNPLAIGLPTSTEPVIFDMATSALTLTEVMLREQFGQELPEGVAIDANGLPTRNPSRAKLGALLPFGGHKGSGLAFMIQALGIVAGSGLDSERDNGCLLLVFDPAMLAPKDDIKHQLSEFVARVKNTPCRPGVAAIRIPSERAFLSRARLLTEGIEIDRPVYDALRAL
jgi:LDH2 family malate/lactate/ureidoglycolate dehydrogenase